MPPEKQDEGKPSGFKVSDRRAFSESGEPKPTPTTPEVPVAVSQPPSGQAPAEVAAQSPQPGSASGPAHPSTESRESRDSHDLPVVDFHTFILSLGSSALLHLGELDHPDGTESTPDLPLAKHTIDIIVMLQQKTKGNLSPPEERLIESLLYDLRLRYFERSKSAASSK